MEILEWTKPDLLETSGNYWKTFAIHTGVKLDIFTLIGEKSVSASDICDSLNGDLRGVRPLLNALAALKLLAKTGDTYTNTPFSLKFLSKNSPEYTGFIILHHHHLVESWNRLSESVLTGRPVRQRSSSHTSSDMERESFLMGMFNIAMGLAPMVAKNLDLSGKETLLDMGGGPGTYAIHFCLENPGLKASVFDLPTTRTFAENTIRRFSLSERIDFIEGSFLEDTLTLPHRFDAAWLSHILHGEGPDDADRIVRHAVSALNPGGTVYIQEFVLDNTMDSPLFPALFSLNMLVGTDQGQAYSEGQLMDMLKKNGLNDIRRLPITGPNNTGIVCGTL
jgi:SAM-dependent methyltransferase